MRSFFPLRFGAKATRPTPRGALAALDAWLRPRGEPTGSDYPPIPDHLPIPETPRPMAADGAARTDADADADASDLADALERGELFLVFQPLLDARTERLRGFEALARWRRGGAIVAPTEFLAFAEASGGVRAIDRWAVSEAVSTLARWRAAGLAAPRISVNLSGLSLSDAALVDEVAAALRHSGTRGADLTLEISEDALAHAGARGVVAELRGLGVRIALDGFGTRHSTLAPLLATPVDEVKLDRSIAAGLGATGRDGGATGDRAAAAIAAMLSALKVDVVFQGIETVEQRDAIRALGCAALQGHYYARPIAESDACDWMCMTADRSNACDAA